jgi:hypothetical protein
VSALSASAAQVLKKMCALSAECTPEPLHERQCKSAPCTVCDVASPDEARVGRNNMANEFFGASCSPSSHRKQTTRVSRATPSFSSTHLVSRDTTQPCSPLARTTTHFMRPHFHIRLGRSPAHLERRTRLVYQGQLPSRPAVCARMEARLTRGRALSSGSSASLARAVGPRGPVVARTARFAGARAETL